MTRIKEEDRLPVVDAHIGHWEQAEIVNGLPLEIATGFGLPQLQTLRDDYEALTDEILQLAETELPVLRAERDAAFGTSSNDPGGVWMRLLQYKAYVKATLGVRHPLVKTIPNIGRVRVGRYRKILDRFIDHWEKVDEAGGGPMTLGGFAIADLEAAAATVEARLTEIEHLEESDLPLQRAERESLFGDVPEEERQPTSIIARLHLYHITIQTQFPGQPIADSLPEIYPGEGESSSVGTFRFNWFDMGDGSVTVWIEMPAGIDNVYAAYMREGVLDQTVGVASMPGEVISIDWQDVTIVDEIDEIELQDEDGLTLARGERDQSIGTPPP